MIRRYGIVFLLLVLGIFNVSILYTAQSYTADEPYHVGAGRQWLETGTTPDKNWHPPLAQAAAALPLHLLSKIKNTDPLAGLSPRDHYIERLWLTRIGILPFFIFSCVLVFFWSRELYGSEAARWALFFYILTPTVIAHAGLATTDMAYAAMFVSALKCGVDWLAYPSNRRSIILGVSLGLMIVSKLSGFAHWPAAMLMIFIAQCVANSQQGKWVSPLTEGHMIRIVFYVFPVTLFVVGCFYQFDYTPLKESIEVVGRANSKGWAIWLFEPLRNQAVWYFFPVVFFFKTPLPFLLLAIISLAFITRHLHRPMIARLFPLLAAAAVLAVSTTSGINLGVRHVLVLYPLLAISVGYAFHLMEKKGKLTLCLAVTLALWQGINFMNHRLHPISFFNELAGDHPEHISLDSDFDWGQDIIALDGALQDRNIDDVYLCARRVSATPRNVQTLLNASYKLCPNTIVHGWVAVSRAERLLRAENFTWLEDFESVQPIGSTMDLYYIP